MFHVETRTNFGEELPGMIGMNEKAETVEDETNLDLLQYSL